jgi:hypothetical protein
VLLARPPGPLPEMAAAGTRIPQAELAVVADLPAEMLRRRPDVRAAEMQLAAQSALIGVSVADLYPSIALLGSLGLSATSLSGAPRKFDWAIGPSLVWNVFDHGRLSNEVLVQDARFQQLYEQYQGTVLQAAREVDDAAVGFVANREQVPLLEEAVKAAQRSLGDRHHPVPRRDGRLRARARFAAGAVQPAGAAGEQPRQRRAEPGHAVQGDGRRLAAGARPAAGRRRDARDDGRAQRLAGPAGGAAAAARCRPATDHTGEGRTMTEESPSQDPSTADRRRSAAGQGDADRRDGRAGADRRQPALVFRRRPADAAHHAGAGAGLRRAGGGRSGGQGAGGARQEQRRGAAGQPLFDIDPSQYRIALQRSRSDYESVQRSVNASAATVEAARASLQAAQANHVKADKDATRQESLYAEDPGAISVRRLEVAQATRIQARSQEKAAEADLRKAQEAAGESGDNNAQLRSARSAIEKAELDLARTKVVAPGVASSPTCAPMSAISPRRARRR